MGIFFIIFDIIAFIAIIGGVYKLFTSNPKNDEILYWSEKVDKF